MKALVCCGVASLVAVQPPPGKAPTALTPKADAKVKPDAECSAQYLSKAAEKRVFRSKPHVDLHKKVVMKELVKKAAGDQSWHVPRRVYRSKSPSKSLPN